MQNTRIAPQSRIVGLQSASHAALQRTCACGKPIAVGGECAECARKRKARTLQHKLAVGATHDPLEREAERVADQVTAASDLHAAPVRLQRSGGAPSQAIDAAPPSVERTLASPGQALEPSLQHEMSARFDHDFSRVRVHTDDAAARSAREVNALAYTVGSDVVFAAGRYAPHSPAGRHLVAHELAHVVQQDAGMAQGVVQRQPSPKDDLQQRLRLVQKQLATGTYVRSPEATARLKEEEARLIAALQEADNQTLRAQLEANTRAQETGSGVRSPEAKAQLRAEGEALQAKLAQSASIASGTQSFLRSGGRPAPYVDWSAGNLRGLAAEGQVRSIFYPEATQLPKGYPGVDFIQGGTRSLLTGFARGQGGKLPLSTESLYIEGGTLIQLKTLRNTDPYYQTQDGLYNTLHAGMKKLVNIKPGAGKSEQVGETYLRVEHSGSADAKILHVELEVAPTPAQQAQLTRLAEAGQSYGDFGPGERIDVVVNWPGKAGGRSRWLEIASGKVVGAAGIGVGIAGAVGRETLRERQLKETGYAPVGLAAHANDSFLVKLGAFFRGDQAESFSGQHGELNMPVWRNNIRTKIAVKQPGETVSFLWQYKNPRDPMPFLEDVTVLYEKQPDGRWKVKSIEDPPPGFSAPNLNQIVDVNVSDETVTLLLSTEKGA